MLEVRASGKHEAGEMCSPDDERNPYTFEIFYLQEKIGMIEQGLYEEVFALLSDEYGEDFFEDFLR